MIGDLVDEFDILTRGETWDQVVELKSESDMLAPVGGQVSFAHLRELDATEVYAAGGRAI